MNLLSLTRDVSVATEFFFEFPWKSSRAWGKRLVLLLWMLTRWDWSLLLSGRFPSTVRWSDPEGLSRNFVPIFWHQLLWQKFIKQSSLRKRHSEIHLIIKSILFLQEGPVATQKSPVQSVKQVRQRGRKKQSLYIFSKVSYRPALIYRRTGFLVI